MSSAIQSSGVTGFAIPTGTLVTSAAANALTIAIKTPLGNDPSPAEPLYTAVRSDFSTDAGYRGRAIVAPLTLTIPSGATGGTNPFRLWVLEFDTGTTIKLAVCDVLGYTLLDEVSPLLASAITSGSAIGVTPFAATSNTPLPYRILGSLDWNSGLAVAGQWTQPDVVRLFGRGSLRPGDIVQVSEFNATYTTSTGTTLIPYDNTIPQWTAEGDFLAGMNFQRTALPPNFVKTEFLCNVSYSVAANIIIALFQGTQENSLNSAVHYVGGGDQIVQIRLTDFRQVGASFAQRSIKIGGDVMGAWRTAGAGGARKLGGVLPEYVMQLTEYMG